MRRCDPPSPGRLGQTARVRLLRARTRPKTGTGLALLSVGRSIEMAKAYGSEELATRVFVIVMLGIAAEIAAMVIFGF